LRFVPTDGLELNNLDNLYLKILLIVISFSYSSSAQSLQLELEKIFSSESEVVLENYLNPISKAFGFNLGSAIYHNAESYSFPHFDIGVAYLSTSIPNKELSIGNSENPTIFGNSSIDSLTPSGINTKRFNIPILQFSMGLGDNTNFLFRYTKWKMNKVGEIKVYGGGIKYELENLLSITPIPLDIAVLAMYQKYTVDHFLEGAIFNMSIVGSKELGIFPIQFYGGAGFLKNITEVGDPASQTPDNFSIGGLEEIRYRLGVNYSLLFLNLGIEYNFGEYTTISSGLRFVL